MVAVGLGLASRGLSLDIVRYDGETDDRFMPGTYPSAPQQNPYFRFGGMDWSGVGWNVEDPRKSVAMVSPKHFVAAGHFAVCGHLAFMAPDGRQVIREVSGTVHVLIDPMSGLVSDLYLGELVEPIGPEWGIAAYPILNLATPDSYLGRIGGRRRLGVARRGRCVGPATPTGAAESLIEGMRASPRTPRAEGGAIAN